MEYIKLNNEIEMPILGIGTFQMQGTECEKSVLCALQNGYRMIDTAEAYGNEEFVGNAIQKSQIKREDLFLVTKINFKSYDNALTTILSSLQKLKTDYIDLLLLHWPFGNYYAAWREMEKLYQERKIRAIGISNFEPDRMIDLIHFNKIVPVINQIETHLFCQRQKEHEWQNKYNVKHMAYAPLGQGRKNEMFKKEEVRSLAAKYSKTAAQVLLRFLTQKDIVVIPKSVHEERIKENIDIFDFTLTDNEMAILSSLDTATAMIGNPEKPEMTEFAMTW
ncbi:MAG: aldo/keto reductase [Alphaproteobacteria bacterium]|nr:aldo/keto reductase [Alphaproteobacteria bacterium]